MPSITFDGADLALDPVPATWRALLRYLDAIVAPRQLLVTDVRFDGIDEPAFRDPAVLDRELARCAVIEVESGTAAVLMGRCLREAEAAIEPLRQSTTAVGDAFRSGDPRTASEGLVQVAEGIQSLVGIVGAAGLAFRVDLDTLEVRGRALSGCIGELARFVERLIAAQQASDWIAAADVLQHDVEPALREWKSVVGLLLDEVGPVPRPTAAPAVPFAIA